MGKFQIVTKEKPIQTLPAFNPRLPSETEKTLFGCLDGERVSTRWIENFAG